MYHFNTGLSVSNSFIFSNKAFLTDSDFTTLYASFNAFNSSFIIIYQH